MNFGPSCFEHSPENFFRAWMRHNIRTYNFEQNGANSATIGRAGGLNCSLTSSGFSITTSPPILLLQQGTVGANKVGNASEEFTQDPYANVGGTSWMFSVPKIIECRFGGFGAIAGRGNGMASAFGFGDYGGGATGSEAGVFLVCNIQAQQFEGWVSKGDGATATGLVLSAPGLPAYAELFTWYRGMIIYQPPPIGGGPAYADFYINGIFGGRISGSDATFPMPGDSWDQIGAGVWALSGANAGAQVIASFMRLSIADLKGD